MNNTTRISVPNSQMKDRNVIYLLFFSSLLLIAIIFFIDEKRYSLDFFLKFDELMLVMVHSFVFAAIPIGLYFSLNKLSFKIKFFIALLGFLPVYLLIAFILSQ